MKKINWKKVRRIEAKIMEMLSENRESRNSCNVKVGGIGAGA